MSRRTRWLLAALVWMLFIFWLSSRPTLPHVDDDLLDALLKKSGHFLVYALLWLLWSRALARPWLAFAIVLAYALSDEFHQLFVPGRHAWWLDVVIDAAGALTALGLSRSRRGQELLRGLGVGQTFDHDVAE